jgi:hypothetical protein
MFFKDRIRRPNKLFYKFENVIVELLPGIYNSLIIKDKTNNIIGLFDSARPHPKDGYEIYVYEWNGFINNVLYNEVSITEIKDCLLSQKFILDCYNYKK